MEEAASAGELFVVSEADRAGVEVVRGWEVGGGVVG